MELEFLGTGAGVPARGRNVSSLALKMLDERNEIWLFDCGEGTQQQILKTAIKPRKITKIFITHLHGDHLYGLPGLLTSRANQGGQDAVDLYGPMGLKQYVQTSLKITGTHLGYPLHYHELTKPGLIFADQQIKVSQQPLDHRIISLGYRVEEAAWPGELQVQNLQAAHIPAGPLYGQLKAGKTVTLADGRQIDGQDFLGPKRPGRVIAIMGDTRPNRNTEVLAEQASVLVHESTFGKQEQKLAKRYYHSTSDQAAQIAKKAHCQKLLLTHISARYQGKGALKLQAQARKVFANSDVVNDFDIIEVPLSKQRGGKHDGTK